MIEETLREMKVCMNRWMCGHESVEVNEWYDVCLLLLIKMARKPVQDVHLDLIIHTIHFLSH